MSLPPRKNSISAAPTATEQAISQKLPCSIVALSVAPLMVGLIVKQAGASAAAVIQAVSARDLVCFGLPPGVGTRGSARGTPVLISTPVGAGSLMAESLVCLWFSTSSIPSCGGAGSL